jgi:hypothetical protein
MRESLNRKLAYLKQKRRRMIGLILVLIVLPDWIARGQFWYGAAAWGWPFLRAFYNSEVGRLVLNHHRNSADFCPVEPRRWQETRI